MPNRTFQFGAFEVNEHAGELRKHGTRIKIQEQPFQVLLLLLDRAGEIVGREEIRGKLWADNTYVDFDNAISSAVRKLREALGDNADNPRFIETLARRGYRFIGSIEVHPPTPPMVPERRRTRAKMIPISAGAVLIAGAATWWSWPRGEPNAARLVPLPLTAAPGWEESPSFSPDGNQVAYAWNERGTGNNSHIYVKMIGSGRPVQVTEGPRPDFFPAWSPDGRNIAFGRAQGQGTAIYLIPPVGGADRKLADGYSIGPMSWSPDGRFLAVADRKSPNDSSSLYLVGGDDGQKLRLTTPPSANTEDRTPVFSPNGRTLLFVRCPKRYLCGLYLLDLSADYHPSGRPRQLREESGAIWGAAWTADGKGAVYASSSSGGWNPHLMKIRVETGAQPERLTYAGESIYELATAPRGNRLAYVQNLTDVDLWQLRAGNSPRSFASSRRFDYYPLYSPDGKHVVFGSDRSGEFEIWVCDAEGGSLAQLTHFGKHSGSPRWSPDGRWIAFDRQLKDGWHIFVMASDGGQVRQLTFDADGENIPSWSQDGNWIYFASKRTGRFEIWKVPVKGGKDTQVTRHGGWVALESYDGRFLYYTKNIDDQEYLSGLWALPLEGGDERLLLKSIGYRAFAVRRDGIYYISSPTANGSASVRFYDFATGKSKEVTSFKENFAGGLTVSPDRKTILFSVFARTGSNVMIVDNFR